LQHLDAHELTVMLLSLGVLIGAARLLGEIAQRFRQPAVLGELLAGVLLGPTVFGSLGPEWQAWLFPPTGDNAIVLDAIGSLAIVLFMLVAGLEVDLSIVWRQGRTALKVGLLGTIIPFAFGLAGAWYMPGALGRQQDADPLIFALFFATAMAISSLPVIAKTLMDLNLYRTDLGMIVVSAAIFNDLIGWTVFAVILGMMGQHGSGSSVALTVGLTLSYAALMLSVGRWAVHRALPLLQAYAHWPAGVLGFIVTLGLLGAALTEYIGVHAIFGSFLVGVALGESTHLQERTRVMLEEFVSLIFAPVFFASIGLRVNFVTHFDWLLVLLVLVIACAGKLFGAYLGARWGGMTTRDRWAVAFGMNARGAMEIILGLLALEAGVIRQPLFVALVVMAILTSAVSGPLIRRSIRRRQALRLMSVVSPKHFQRNLTATTRFDAIRELTALACRHNDLNGENVEKVAWEREQVAATGIGSGVALPHARVAGLAQPMAVVGLSDAGLDFDAPDGKPAHVVFLLLTPAEDPTVQLDLSADIAGLFRDPRALEHVLRAKTYTEFLAALKTATPKGADL
jgi:Kef-type K+ transport system membrane component KefB/mannitol/fructose-specific phosphotransferase system IIA component (Ntr-type)